MLFWSDQWVLWIWQPKTEISNFMKFVMISQYNCSVYLLDMEIELRIEPDSNDSSNLSLTLGQPDPIREHENPVRKTGPDSGVEAEPDQIRLQFLIYFGIVLFWSCIWSWYDLDMVQSHWANDPLQIATTCQQLPHFWGPEDSCCTQALLSSWNTSSSKLFIKV